MYCAIDDNLLSFLKAIAASDHKNDNLVGELEKVEDNPLISSLMWTKADVLAASRKLIQGDSPKNPDGKWFNRNIPFADAAREELAREIAGGPDAVMAEGLAACVNEIIKKQPACRL